MEHCQPFYPIYGRSGKQPRNVLETDFMVQYLVDKALQEAQMVLDEGKKLWQAYFEITIDVTSVRNEPKIKQSRCGLVSNKKSTSG